MTHLSLPGNALDADQTATMSPPTSVDDASTRLCRRPVRRLASAGREAGMTTAEYAVGTVAACGFGGVLYRVITSTEVLNVLKQVIVRAFRLLY